MKESVLALLLISGLCTLCSSHSRQYHFVNTSKTWMEAQTYCRKYYTDLATIDNQEEMGALMETANGYAEDIWIGLYDDPNSWQWSQADGHFYGEREIQFTNWGPAQPDHSSGNPYVLIQPDGTWSNYPRNTTAYFVCHSGSAEGYVFVRREMTWGDARRYCRENHTDLVSIRNPAESESLLNGVGLHYAWIGLFRHTWTWWSDRSRSPFREWQSSQPDGAKQSCGTVRSALMGGSRCDALKGFACYSDNLVVVRENKTWDEALSYCRQHYRDLASPSTEQLQFWVEKRAEAASTAHLWLGLNYSCTLQHWLWINEDTFGYQNWALGCDASECGHRGAVESKEGQWVSLPKTERLNFICSKCEGDRESNSTVRQRLVMRVKLRAPSSLNMSDPAVAEAILQQWKRKLADKGITGVKMWWGKQQDGQIFHLKEKVEQKEKKCGNPED